jgi:hypothetical protein
MYSMHGQCNAMHAADRLMMMSMILMSQLADADADADADC